MTSLKNVQIGQNKYCGPAVLSALTGKTTDECAEVISRINGDHFVRGVKLVDLLQALDKLRFDAEKIELSGVSIYRSILSLISKPGKYIVMPPHHYVVVEVTDDKRAWLVDNHTKEPIKLEMSARLMQRVEFVYKVTPRPEPKLLRTEFNVIKSKSDLTNSYTIYRDKIYENPKDNESIRIGFIYASDDELDEIIARMNQKELENE